nr:reverse transcriptase domain-containing protein [Tanacetum cinerariifolium]
MHTRNSYFPNNSSVTIPRRRNKRRTPNVVEPELRTIIEVALMADNRTMKELLQAPTKGYGEAIVIPKINADHFEIKTNFLQLDVPNDVIKLMMFPYSLKGSARIWYDKEPPNSILTWEDLVNKFVNQFFPPSKTTHLKNEISRFTQRFEETFREAWERFKQMLRAYSLNAAACENILSKTTRETLHIIESKSKVRYSRNKSNVSRMNTTSWENASKTDDMIDKLADQISTLVDIFSKKVFTPATVKAVEESCVTCGGNHAYYNCDATNSNQSSVCATTGTYNQVAPQNHASNYMAPPGFAPVQNNSQNSGVAYEGPSIPTKPSPKKVVERETEETTDKEQTNFQGSTAHIQPPVIPILEPDVLKTLPKPNIPYPLRLNDQKLLEKATNQMEKFFQIFQNLHFDISFADALLLMPKFASTIKSLLADKDKLFKLAKIPLNENCSVMLLKKLLEKLGDPDKFLIPCDFLGMDVCHALADLGASINLMPLSIWKKFSLLELTPTRMTLELADQSITHPKGVVEDFFVKRKITLRVNDEAVTFNLNQTTRYSSTYDDMSVNRIDIIDFCREEYAQEMLGFSNNFLGGNPTSTSEPIIFDSSPSLTPFEGSDFILEEIEAYLKDESISPKINHDDCDPEGDICLIENLLNDDPFQLPTMDLKQGEDYKPAVQIQRRVNLKIHEVIKKEVIKLLDAGMIYPISDSLWVIPIHCVPKKGGITIVENENNELIPTRLVTVKGVRSFLGHAGFYRRFIQDFSKIARPMTHLLEKETPFVFSKDCIDAFETLKKKLTEAPILVVPDWNLPFELMCDASDFAIGAVLGQHKMSQDVITIGSTMRIPLLYRGEYSQWRERFMNYLEEKTDGEAMINSIYNGDQPLHTAEEKKTRKIDCLARSLFIQGLLNDIYSLIDSNETAKDLWDALERQMRGSEYGEQDRKAAILYEYETFKASEGEQLLDTYLRYLQVVNDLKKCGYKKYNCDVNDALGYKKKAVVVTSDLLALVAEKTKSANKKQEFVKSDDKKVKKKDDEKKRDMSKVKCYNCKKEGHFAKDCKKTKVKDYNYYKTKMLLVKKDSDEQVLLAEDQAWMESKESSSSTEETISEVAYYTSESESESEYETLEYYDNSTNYGLFVNDNDNQEIFHDAMESASENFIENHIDSQKDYDKSEDDLNDSEEKEHLVDKLIQKFNHKISKCQKHIEKANQQSKYLENQNKDLQDKYDVLINQVNTFEEQNNEFNEQIKVLNEKNADLLSQTEVLQDQLK